MSRNNIRRDRQGLREIERDRHLQKVFLMADGLPAVDSNTSGQWSVCPTNQRCGGSRDQQGFVSVQAGIWHTPTRNEERFFVGDGACFTRSFTLRKRIVVAVQRGE